MSTGAPLPTGAAWLFCPADRPERFEKAAAAADVVILDLEDAVAPDAKARARENLAATPLDPERTVVRVNAHGTDDHALDVAALEATEYSTVMLAKAESADAVAALSPRSVVALIETPLGALRVEDVAGAPNTVGLMWGAEDLIAGLGGRSSRTSDGGYAAVASHVRSRVLLAAKAYGRLALDAVHLDIADLDGLAREAADAANTGFSATVCIHPSQVAVVRAAYRPSDAAIERARRILAAAAGERGVFAFDGAMVDAPVLHQARAVLARATVTRPSPR